MWWISVSSIVLLILTGYQILWMFSRGLCHLLEKKVGKSYASNEHPPSFCQIDFGEVGFVCFCSCCVCFQYIYRWEINCIIFAKMGMCIYQVEDLVKLLNWFGGVFWHVKMPFLRKDKLKYNLFYRFWLFSSPVLVNIVKTASSKAEV